MQAQGSPLVQGAAAAAQAARRVRVLRAFLLGGQRQEVGAVVEVTRQLAAELVHQRRAELVEPTAPPPAAPAAKTTRPRAAARQE